MKESVNAMELRKGIMETKFMIIIIIKYAGNIKFQYQSLEYSIIWNVIGRLEPHIDGLKLYFWFCIQGSLLLVFIACWELNPSVLHVKQVLYPLYYYCSGLSDNYFVIKLGKTEEGNGSKIVRKYYCWSNIQLVGSLLVCGVLGIPYGSPQKKL